MKLEIERKFLLKNDSWRSLAKGIHYQQGYLCLNKHKTIRVRVGQGKGYLTIKGATHGAARVEYEYPIPESDAIEMLTDFCQKPIIEKYRHEIEFKGFMWEVDEFYGENKGLVIAEIELESEGQFFEKPDWVGDEVTGNPRYYNANLVVNPYHRW